MSYAAVTWAFAQDIDKASTKFVLVALGQCVRAESLDMVVWPSARRLASMTGQDIKTVEAALKRLRESGHIEDTGDREGETGQVIVYRLKTPENGGITPSANTSEIPAKTTENGGAGNQSNTTVFPVKHPQISLKDPRFSGPTPPKTGDGIGKGIGKKGEGKGKSADAPHIDGVSDELLTDWLAVRKAKKAGELTPTAVSMLVREAKKVGLTTAQAVEYCCGAGWQGFNAGWYAKRENLAPMAAAKPTRHSGLSTKNYSEGVNADGTFA